MLVIAHSLQQYHEAGLIAWEVGFPTPRRTREQRAEVRERAVDGHPTWVAVFAGLKAGGYQVVGPWGGQEARVEMAPGRATELDWRDPAPPETP